MKFYNSLIEELNSCIDGFDSESYSYSESKIWHEDDHQTVILSRDTAYELNGCGFNLVTSMSVSDGVFVIGDDLSSILSDRCFSRISIIQLDETDDEQTAFNLIKKIEYTKYHFFPTGYMMRTASTSHSEKVRVSLSAIKKGINFSSLGNLFIKKYKENKSVKAVKIIFITDDKIDYSRLNDIAKSSGEITKALDHVMSSVNFDCDTCKLKAVCDEVEGLRELHFKDKMN